MNKTQPDPSEELTIQQVADIKKRHRNTVMNWTRRKKNPLQCIRYSKRDVVITRAALDAFVEKSKTRGAK